MEQVRRHGTRTCHSTRKRRGTRTRRWLAVAVAGYLGVLAINRSQVVVAGSSMEPSLWAGDRLLTVPALPRLLGVGQVVVVRDPFDDEHLVVKRIAAIDGDEVTVLGDAPDRSTDSRTWGPVPPSAVRRIAVRRWPDVLTPLRTVRPSMDDR